MKNKRLASAAAIAALGVLAGKATGFFREMSYAASFGASIEMDHYLVAMVFPIMLLNISAALFPAMLTPRFLTYKQHADASSLSQLHILLTYTFLFYMLTSVLIAWNAEALISIIAPSYSSMELKETAQFVRWLIPSASLSAALLACTTLLQAHQKLTAVAFVQVPANAALITMVIVLAPSWGTHAIIPALYLSSFIQLVWLWRPLKQLQLPIRLQFLTGQDQIRLMMATAVPLLLSSTFVQTISFVERSWGASFNNGTLSYLNYSLKALELSNSAIYAIIAMVIFPRLTQSFIANNNHQFQLLLIQGFRLVVLLMAPMTGLFALHPEWIISILYERGVFSSLDTHATSRMLVVFAWALVPMLLRDLLNFTFIATGRFRITLLSTGIQMAVYLITLPLWTANIGAQGIPAANVTATWIQLLFLIVLSLRDHGWYSKASKLLVDVIKISLSAVGSTLILLMISPWLETWSQLPKILLGVVCLYTFYIVIAYILGIRIQRSVLKRDHEITHI